MTTLHDHPPRPSTTIKRQALVWMSAFTLICFTAACDEARAAGAPETRGGDKSTDEIRESTYKPGRSVLGHATCELSGATAAACGTGDLRLRPCDQAWVSRCKEIGGKAVASKFDGPRLTAFLTESIGCSAMTPLQRPCDKVFVRTCETHDFTFVPFSTLVSHGQCVAPEKCSAEATCPNGSTIKCSLKGDGACSSQSGSGGHALCIGINADGDAEPPTGGTCGS